MIYSKPINLINKIIGLKMLHNPKIRIKEINNNNKNNNNNNNHLEKQDIILIQNIKYFLK